MASKQTDATEISSAAMHHRPYTNRRDIWGGCGWVVRSFLTVIVRGMSIDKTHRYNDCTIP
jgi:hypothetical protein